MSVLQVKRGSTNSWNMGKELNNFSAQNVNGRDSIISCNGIKLKMNIFTSSAEAFPDAAPNVPNSSSKHYGLFIIDKNEIMLNESDSYRVAMKISSDASSGYSFHLYGVDESGATSPIDNLTPSNTSKVITIEDNQYRTIVAFVLWDELRDVPEVLDISFSIKNLNEKETLQPGQLGLEYTEGGGVKLKAGMPGVSKWNELPYIGNTIIDVLSLPADNIDTGALYRLNTANLAVDNGLVEGDTSIIYVDALPETGLPTVDESGRLNWYYNTSDDVVSSYIDEAMSAAVLEYGFNLPIGWYPVTQLYEMIGLFCDLAIIQVDALPEQGLPVTDVSSGDPTGLCLYYNHTDNGVYAYITDTLSNVASSMGSTVPSGWYPFENVAELLGMNYGGVITSMDDAVDSDAQYILLSSALYHYNNQWEPVLAKQVQADWDQTDDTQPDYIRNKPIIARADWSVTDESRPDAIKNKPFGDIKQGTIAYDGMISCNSTFEGIYFTRGTYLSNQPKLLNGVAYKVILDGNELGEVVAENNTLQYSEHTYFRQDGFQLFDRQLDGEYHLRIVVAKDSSYQIDPKYLPPTIGRAGTATGAEIFNDYENNIASDDYSHAEGGSTTASGHSSHAEGWNTTASGTYSHAEGGSTTASGHYSHAEGYGSDASGHSSHVEGWNTTASGSYSHVQGKWNLQDDNNIYAHIVGNGEGVIKRSNAHTLDWNGNAWFQGNVYVGGTGQDDAAAKRLLTEDDMPASSLPETTTADNGKLLQVVDGKPTWVTITNGNEVAY